MTAPESTNTNGGTMNNKTVIWAIAAVVVASIAAQAVITIAGKDGASLGDLLQQIGTLVAALAAAGGLHAASSAARSSEAAAQSSAAAERQTNGSLTQRINDAVAAGNAAQLDQLLQLLEQRLPAAATHPAAPQDFLSTPPSSTPEAGNSPVPDPRE